MNREVAVLGLGLIGGTVSAAATRAGARVRGYDPNPEAARMALQRGLIVESVPELEECVAGVDVVVLAAPVEATLESLPEVDAAVGEGAIVLDVASVKAAVVARMAELPGGFRCVGGHPIAGRETSGPGGADAALLKGRSFVLCPSVTTTSETVERAAEFVMELGARAVVMDAVRHDQILARTSHLPQLLSTALALAVRPGDAEYAGTGLADMVRLARSDPSLWGEIFMHNAENVADAAAEVRDLLDSLIRMLRSGEVGPVEAAMANGATRVAEVRQS